MSIAQAKIRGVLTAINSERDRNGNTYWALRYVDTQTGICVEASISGGESNIYAILLHWNNKKDWDRSVLFQTLTLKKREFRRMTADWPYGGCRPEDLAAFIKAQLREKKGAPC